MPPSASPPVELKIAPCPTVATRRLQEQLGVSTVLADVLVRRGLDDPATARSWLAADVRHDPSAFEGLDDALELILSHVHAGSPITVHGDYDVDGVCSTAILVGALRRLGAPVDWYLPSRSEDGYGLSLATVERLRDRGTRLLITADCAITAVEEVAAARAAGLDVVVTDHHTPRADGSLPDAPIVHPGVCGYPCRELCATGVVHKLTAALYERAGLGAATADEDLDLVALATVADVVALTDENRRLVREGLRSLAATTRPGLRALMRVTHLDPSAMSARAIGFRLAPRINAAGRLYRADAALELLLTQDPERAEAVAQELDRINLERRHTETRIVFEAEAEVARQGEQPAYVLAGEGWHPGVVGIVASRIAERHHRPAILVALPAPGSEPGPGTGSGRSIPGFDLLAGLRAAGGHLLSFGGHAAAAGLTVNPAQLEDFRRAFTDHAASVLSPELLTQTEHVDAVVCGEDLGTALAEELERLAPFGQGNPEVTLLLRAAALEDPRPMGEGRHLRLTVAAGAVRSRAVCFGSSRLAVSADEPADATFRLELNEFQGAVEPRLVLRQGQRSRPEPIRCPGGPESYLAGVWRELDASPLPAPSPHPDTAGRRVHDLRGRGPGGTISRLVASGEGVLVVCADRPRRLEHLGDRVGGFALCSVDELRHAAEPDGELLIRRGRADQCTYLAWGEAELRFAELVHEREYGLRAPITALYRALRDAPPRDGAELELLLRQAAGGEHSAPRSGRCLRVLVELGLITVDRATETVALAPAVPTELDRSPAFRAYEQHLRDGRRCLRSATPAAA